MDNLNNGIIDLLNKKYKIYNYIDYNNTNFRKITKKELKEYINYDLFIIKNIIDDYINIDNNLCLYDIDIVNLIIKSILINKKLPIYKDNDYKKSNLFINLLYTMFGYTNEKNASINYKKTNDYFNNNALKLNKKIKEQYLKIADIILKFSK